MSKFSIIDEFPIGKKVGNDPTLMYRFLLALVVNNIKFGIISGVYRSETGTFFTDSSIYALILISEVKTHHL